VADVSQPETKPKEDTAKSTEKNNNTNNTNKYDVFDFSLPGDGKKSDTKPAEDEDNEDFADF
jgi:hypothetical protein